MESWSLKKTGSVIVGSVILTLSLSIGGYRFWKEQIKERAKDEKYQITSIIQTGPEKEALKTECLAEILGLSQDAPTSLYAIDLKAKEQKLFAFPLISKAKLKKIFPNTLYVDYEIRHPVAKLSDYENIGVDKEGYIFPLSPFFSPKNLPEIYLGLPSFGALEDGFEREGGSWEKPLKNKYFSLALSILEFLKETPWKEGLEVQKIDVSNAYASTLGQREVVLFTEEEIVLSKEKGEVVCYFPKILRLMPRDYQKQLTHFFALRKTMIEDYKSQVVQIPKTSRFAPRIIDLRIPHLAFVENH